MDIVLRWLQGNLKTTLKHIDTKISSFLYCWGRQRVIRVEPRYQRVFFLFSSQSSCCLSRHCDALMFPFQPGGLMLLIQTPVGASRCDLESCRTWLAVDSSELLALAESIILHSITGGGECWSGSMTLNVFFLSAPSSVSLFFFCCLSQFFSHKCQIIVY